MRRLAGGILSIAMAIGVATTTVRAKDRDTPGDGALAASAAAKIESPPEPAGATRFIGNVFGDYKNHLSVGVVVVWAK